MNQETTNTYDRELENMDREDEMIQVQTQEYLANFANAIKKIDKKYVTQTINQPHKFKIPFKVKVRRFFNKLVNTLY